MAKAELSVNYESPAQESSSKPFKDFKKVANSQDFSTFFEARFQSLEPSDSQRKDFKVYKVSAKETLAIQVFLGNDPAQLDVGTYNIIHKT